jgi:hypothetical protein
MWRYDVTYIYGKKRYKKALEICNYIKKSGKKTLPIVFVS